MSKELTSDLIQKAKDQVAKKNGFDDWTHVQKAWLDRLNHVLVVHENYVEQTAEVYASLQNAELLKEKLELIDMLDEARAQIEYMQEYTGPMGTCSTVLSRIESLIEKYTDKK